MYGRCFVFQGVSEDSKLGKYLVEARRGEQINSRVDGYLDMFTTAILLLCLIRGLGTPPHVDPTEARTVAKLLHGALPLLCVDAIKGYLRSANGKQATARVPPEYQVHALVSQGSYSLPVAMWAMFDGRCVRCTCLPRG